MSKLTSKERNRLAALASSPDTEIETSDIPERQSIPVGFTTGRFYRPVKQSVTIRLDSDVLAWLKASGTGYQTRVNTYLRSLMTSQSKTTRRK